MTRSPRDGAIRSSERSFYEVDFKVDDRHPLQQTLNQLYRYAGQADKVFHRNRLNLFALIVNDLIARSIITKFDSALDVGCNVGVYSRMLSDAGFRRVTGIDVDADHVARAEAEFGIPGCVDFRLQGIEDLPHDQRFDFVVCAEVIEHTADPERTAAILKAAVTPGGVLFVTLPNVISFPFLAGYVSSRARRKPISQVLRDHLCFPFYRSLNLFRDSQFDRVTVAGNNLFFHPRIIRALHTTRMFEKLNIADFRLSLVWPLRYFTASFGIVLKKH